MPRIVETTETAYLIEKIVKETSRCLIMVSPFLQIHSRLEKILKTKFKEASFTLHIITRSSEKKKIIWMPVDKTFITYIDKLHAKYYYNEIEGIITSMNLYEYSQVNNIELGVHFTNQDEQFNFLKDHYWQYSAFAKPLLVERKLTRLVAENVEDLEKAFS
jgi:hypothetical protein